MMNIEIALIIALVGIVFILGVGIYVVIKIIYEAHQVCKFFKENKKQNVRNEAV